MPTHLPKTPSLRHHKPSGQAVMTLNGRDVYLGPFGSPQSRSEYDRLIAEWLLNGRRLPVASGAGDITVNELLVAYLDYADAYYVKHGKPTTEPASIRQTVRPMRKLYGHTLAKDFGPLALKVVRQEMIASGLCRNEVNKRLGKLKRVFKWGVSEELIPSAVFHGLSTVSGLRQGRADVRESQPVRPVHDGVVDALRPHVARQVWTMIELQRLTGMRPGEVIMMRTCDVATSGRVWSYTPASHKTEHHGRSRVIHLGPRAEEVLRPWLKTDLTAFLFSPKDVLEEHYAARRRNRKTPMTPSHRARTQRARSRVTRRGRTPGDHYTSMSYLRTITAACKKADVPHWHPNQLRHSFATMLRKEFGLDVARTVLGHSSSSVTEIYAEIDSEKAADAMLKLG